MSTSRYERGHGYRPGHQNRRIAADVGPWAVVMAQRALEAHEDRMVCAFAALTVGCAYARLHGYSEAEFLEAVREAWDGRNRLVPVRVVPCDDSIVRDYQHVSGFTSICEAINDAAADAAFTVKAMVAASIIVAGRLVAYSRTTRQDLEAAAALVWKRQPEWWAPPTDGAAA